MAKKKNKIFKRIKNNILYLFIRALIGFFRILPRKAALTCASILGRIAPMVLKKERELAEKHLTIAFGDERSTDEIHRISRDIFRFMAMNFVDLVRIRTMDQEEIVKSFVPHDIDRLKDVLAKGNGAIVLTSHAGCYDFLGAYISISVHPVSVVTRKLYDPRLEQLLLENRAHANVRNISRGQDTRDIIRALKEKNILGFLIDQDTKVKGVFVDFFGKPAFTAVAPALLSLKYNVPVVPMFTYRDEQDRHHACTYNAISIQSSGDMEKDIIELTTQLSKVTESFIREHPEQWVWFHKRWKTQP